MNLIYLAIANSFLLLQNEGANGNLELFNLINTVIYFILGLSVVLNILFFSNRNSSGKNNKSPSGNKGNHEAWYKSVDKKNKILNAENKSLQNELIILQKKMDSFLEESSKRRVENIQPSVSSPKIDRQIEDELPKTFDLSLTKPETIFLPSPFENNRFSIEDVSNDQTPSSLYQIILDDSATTGKLLIIENANFTRALNSPDHYLEKACVFENAFSPTAKGINTVEPGKVKVDNQDWLIIEKIKIKFI